MGKKLGPYPNPWASQVVLVVKNLPANAGDADTISGSEGSPRDSYNCFFVQIRVSWPPSH